MSSPPLPAPRLHFSLRSPAPGRHIWWLDREERASSRRTRGLLRRRLLQLQEERGAEVAAAAAAGGLIDGRRTPSSFPEELGAEVAAAAGGRAGRTHGRREGVGDRSNGDASANPRPSTSRRKQDGPDGSSAAVQVSGSSSGSSMEQHATWDNDEGAAMVSLSLSGIEEMGDEFPIDKGENATMSGLVASTNEAPSPLCSSAGRAEGLRDGAEAATADLSMPRPSLRGGSPQDRAAGTGRKTSTRKAAAEALALEALFASADVLGPRTHEADDAGDDAGASFAEHLADSPLPRGGATPGGRRLARDDADDASDAGTRVGPAVPRRRSGATPDGRRLAWDEADNASDAGTPAGSAVSSCLGGATPDGRRLVWDDAGGAPDAGSVAGPRASSCSTRVCPEENEEIILTQMMNQSMEDDEWVSPEGEDAGVESELKQDKLELHHYVTAVSQLQRETMSDKINHQLDGIPPSPSLIANRATTPSHPKAQSRTSNSKSNLQTPQKYTHTRQQDRWSTHGISTETGARESRDKPSENGAPKNSRSAKAPKDGVPPPVHDHNEARTNNPRLGGLTPRPKEKPKISARKCYFFQSPRKVEAARTPCAHRPCAADARRPNGNAGKDAPRRGGAAEKTARRAAATGPPASRMSARERKAYQKHLHRNADDRQTDEA